MEKGLKKKDCVHAVGVSQKGQIIYIGGGQEAPDCGIVHNIPFNWCPFCGIKIEQKGIKNANHM